MNHNPDRTDYPIQLSEKNRLYIEMAFEPKDYIKEVWISPHGQREAYEVAVTYYRQKYNLRFAIQKSKIPFRA